MSGADWKGKEGVFTGIVSRPQAVLILGFLAIIALGGILLSLPFSHANPVSVLDAFFTSVSAVCVTGLVTKDTGVDFSVAGQWIILFLIQIGGLGIMTFSALFAFMLGRKISMRSQYILQDVFLPEQSSSSFKRILVFIVVATFSIEGTGAMLLWAHLGFGKENLFVAVFHSVSAFCNAGFSTFSDSLVRFRGDAFFNILVMALIVVGGLGHIVLFEISTRTFRRKEGKPLFFSLHTRIVFYTSLSLIAVGAVFIFLFEYKGSMNNYSFSERIYSSIFQSVTPRTAGFNTMDISMLTTPSLLLIIIFMLIGGSPGSTAGGMKTTTFVVAIASFRSWLKGGENIVLLKREIPGSAGKRAVVIAFSMFFLLGLGVFFLSVFESGFVKYDDSRFGFMDLLFETASALGTVGLSTGVTPSLSCAGKITIMVLMFTGRLGPLTLASFAAGKEAKPEVGYPEERVMLG